ncbi:pyrimidine/purine nucleoside phosphorylase [Psychrobium sp. 1_MG-2023]|uniref:pyrimidine/purine nucleoside phosphorylase n=1 Tax=Psychrobium sp. 1_MG-2023 TaxID=3062624 RepID=UPI000C332945|nr:pyrimidine/purine nucleoside phosphorylase [Psychrobium sp. 1_MG-2023]MDP2562741.1 pyrimidine/purine nucleoside phosphorylase [Psychrobium sp. 1_MG-2023]PKF54258.1 hypothetical protein CW748_16655 [Alteromonadales bacterium alter-6D02]
MSEVTTQFESVTAITQSNIYFDGKVVSHKIILSDGSEKTLGVMLAGEYTFNTEAAEVMEVTQGEMQVLLPGQSWQVFKAGQSYNVPANSQFSLKIDEACDYICSYLN